MMVCNTARPRKPCNTVVRQLHALIPRYTFCFLIQEARLGVFHGYQKTLSNEKKQVKSTAASTRKCVVSPTIKAKAEVY